MKKTYLTFLCVLLPILLCACANTSQPKSQPQIKYQGIWYYDMMVEENTSITDILTINNLSANYTREVTFYGAKNTSLYANYELQISEDSAYLMCRDAHGLPKNTLELTLAGDILIVKSDNETMHFKKR